MLGDEPQSAASLAAATGCNPDALDRFLRALSGCDIFERLPDGRYQHTPISRCLRSDALVSAAPSAQLQATPIYQRSTGTISLQRTQEFDNRLLIRRAKVFKAFCHVAGFAAVAQDSVAKCQRGAVVHQHWLEAYAP